MIADDFAAFHAANPEVYRRLVELAAQWRRAGHRRCGIGMLFEVLRWESGLQTSALDYKLNNNFRAHYARLIESEHPELAGLFELRVLRAQ